MSEQPDHDYRQGGWKEKYLIHKSDGSPVDPNAVYFVLRLDADPHARKAALAYADSVESENAVFAEDIRIRARALDPGFGAASDSLRQQGF